MTKNNMLLEWKRSKQTHFLILIIIWNFKNKLDYTLNSFFKLETILQLELKFAIMQD